MLEQDHTTFGTNFRHFSAFKSVKVAFHIHRCTVSLLYRNEVLEISAVKGCVGVIVIGLLASDFRTETLQFKYLRSLSNGCYSMYSQPPYYHGVQFCEWAFLLKFVGNVVERA
ncbi:hypothetical protein M378DRAFT_161669 [Amanita muscaria Koide BX008]|uniref:Uncharacterized protein n=1 Tax=Amanita muscaria (strain Koide BX008) TaxID=946122 RepID=A0A0C2TFP8_AMAMK|nr:hypothetical protein M378DRAFT_161669 [Amanita muscaria Koide BX008]